MQSAIIQLGSKLDNVNESKTRTVSGFSFITWGKDNDYPLFLNYLYHSSAPHRAFIDGKVQYYLSMLNLPDTVDNDLIYKCLLDYEIKNAFAIKRIYNEQTRQFDYEHVKIDNLRVSNNGEEIYECTNWTKPKNIIVHNNLLLNKFGNGIFLYINDVYDYIDSNNELVKAYYPTPTYVAAIQSILADISISNFDYTEILNGFKSGTLITLNDGVPETTTEQNEIISNLRNSLTKSNKYGGIVVLFSSSKENSPEITQVNGNNLVSRYQQLRNELLQRIIIAHNITSPMLVGVKTAGQLGGSTEIAEAREIFETKYIMPRLRNFVKFITNVTNFNFNVKNSDKTQRIWVDDKENNIENVINEITKHGIDRNNVNIISDNISELKQIQQSELILTKLQDNVLSMLMQGESLHSIAKALSVGMVDVATAYDELVALRLISDDGKITRLGKEVSKQGQLLQVFYEYKARTGMGEDIIPTTRPFCRKMVNHTMNKLLTRKDIEMVSSRVGLDVWNYRGGYYHDPRDGKNYPFCRHEWRQVIGVINK